MYVKERQMRAQLYDIVKSAIDFLRYGICENAKFLEATYLFK